MRQQTFCLDYNSLIAVMLTSKQSTRNCSRMSRWRKVIGFLAKTTFHPRSLMQTRSLWSLAAAGGRWRARCGGWWPCTVCPTLCSGTRTATGGAPWPRPTPRCSRSPAWPPTSPPPTRRMTSTPRTTQSPEGNVTTYITFPFVSHSEDLKLGPV